MPASTRATRSKTTTPAAGNSRAVSQTTLAPPSTRLRSTRSKSAISSPSNGRTSISPSPAPTLTTLTAQSTPSPPSEEAESEDEDGDLIIVEKDDMLHSAGNERSGLRGRNVEDLSELEEKGLLRRNSSEKTLSAGRKDKGKEKMDVRMEKQEYEGDEGLNNPRDRNAFALLVLLYLLQGIPLGLTFGTLPFLLKSQLSYSQLAIFALATWPYSLKLLWSPIVDAWFVPKWGRRKSWIVPVQAIVGLGLWLIGGRIETWLQPANLDVRFLTAVFGSLIVASATQDIAVDGWALTLLSQQNLSYASTAQTIGIGIGSSLSFTVFLALNSVDFSNRYFRSQPLGYGLVSLGGYIRFWAVIFVAVTVGIAIYKTEDPVSEDDPDMDVRKVYAVMWSIIRLKNIQSFLLVLLVCKIGFLVNDSVTGLKLLEKGLSKEDLAVAVLLDFPAQMIAGWLVAKWSRPAPGRHPLTGTGDILRPWIMAFWARLCMAAFATGVVNAFPRDGKVKGGYFAMVVATTLLSSLTSTVQFIGISAFHNQIADPLIGGTYMTLLNTISNLGGTMPKPLILRGVDLLTAGHCSIATGGGSCTTGSGKESCEAAGGYCIITRDGYYIMSFVCVTAGAALFVGYILPTVKRLQTLPMSSWRVKIPN